MLRSVEAPGACHTAAAGVKCCRACTAAAPRSTVRFRLIEGPCAKAGTRYEGALTVHGPHARSRWWCDSHEQAAKRSASKGEAVIVDIIPPSALPADRFCAVCARLLVNQHGGNSDYSTHWRLWCLLTRRERERER